MYYALELLHLTPTDIYDMDIGFILDLIQTKVNFQSAVKEKSKADDGKPRVIIRDATQADFDRL